jgi:hypothetical protein
MDVELMTAADMKNADEGDFSRSLAGSVTIIEDHFVANGDSA